MAEGILRRFFPANENRRETVGREGGVIRYYRDGELVDELDVREPDEGNE